MAQIDRDLNKVYNKIELQKAKLSKPTMSMAKIANMAQMFDQAYLNKNEIAFKTYVDTPTEENFNTAKGTISKDSFVLPQMKDINNEMLQSLEALESKNSVNRSNINMINETLGDGDDKTTVKDISIQIAQSEINSGNITNLTGLNELYKNLSGLSAKEVQDGYSENIMPAIEKLLNTKGIGTDRDAFSISKEGSSNPEVQLGIYNYLKNETLSPKDQLSMINKNQEQMMKEMEKAQDNATIAGIARIRDPYQKQSNTIKAILDSTRIEARNQLLGNESKIFQNKLTGYLQNSPTMTSQFGTYQNKPSTYNAFGQYEGAFNDIRSMATLLSESKLIKTDNMENLLNKYINDPSSDNFLDLNDLNFENKYAGFMNSLTLELNQINDSNTDLYKSYFMATDEIFKGIGDVILDDERFQPPKERQLVPDSGDKETAGVLTR
tara:strand:- start:1460 stop:2773 length:1314 start_codon:yes stop_codon:yes gene_type:complete